MEVLHSQIGNNKICYVSCNAIGTNRLGSMRYSSIISAAGNLSQALPDNILFEASGGPQFYFLFKR